ncbi:MAG: hypothetical protein ACR2PK_00970 [Acidimicrobiales bacterium]
MVEEPEASLDDSDSRPEESQADARDVADASAGPDDDVEPLEGDELPADLDITGLVGPYEFPNNSKRRIASVLYFAIGAICVWLGATVDSSLVNVGFVVAGIGLIVFAIYSFVFAVDTRVEETDALAIAGAQVGFPLGHAAAQMNWRGWRSRPVWRILLYSDEAPQPEQRALVLVDGVSGDVLEYFVEDNPEDWSDLV